MRASSRPRPPRRAAADDDRAAARPEQPQHFADRGGAIAGGHAAEQPAGIVDDHEIEGGIVGGQAGRRRGFDFHQHACLRGALPGARSRRFVRHEGDGAARQPDFLGDRRQPPAVGASNLRHSFAQPDAGHADDEHVRLLAASSTVPEQIEHRSSVRVLRRTDAQLTAVGSRLSATNRDRDVRSAPRQLARR